MCASWSTSWICCCSRMSLTEKHRLVRYMCSLGEELNLPLHSWVCLNNSHYNTFTSHLPVVGGLVGGDFARECFRTWCIACAVCWGVEFPTALRWAQLNNTAYHIQFSVFCPVSSCLTITSPCKAVDLPVCVIFIQCSDGLSSPCWHREKCVCINYSCILLMLFAVLGSFKFWCCDSHRWCTLLYLTQSSRHVCHQVQ